MKLLATFNQKDIFPEQEDNKQNIIFEDRLTGKAIVFDHENKIALVGNKVNSYYLLPGGGIDSGESIPDGIIRECKEEIGCTVTLLNNIGAIEDYRNRDKKHCINYCYTAKLIGEKGELKLTEDEEKNGMHVMWVPLDDALKILEKEVLLLKKGEVNFYNTGYNILRDHLFLKELEKLSKTL
jgi:ADP-ribose pyrophosphatase YjhB (NUDIX family)